MFALDASFTHLIVETHCLNAVQMINYEGECMAVEGGLVEEIYRLRHQCFHFSVKYVPQCVNTVAHQIAQYSMWEQVLAFWFKSGLLWLKECIQHDSSTF